MAVTTERPGAAPRRVHRRLWWRWFVATSLGEFGGFAVPSVVGAAAFALGFPDVALLFVMVPAGAAEGAVLGFAQSRVLSDELPAPAARRWIPATTAGAAFAWTAGMLVGTLSESLDSLSRALLIAAWLVAGVAILHSLGFAQWLVLRRHVRRAGWWVPITAGAWLPGLAIVFAAMALVGEDDPPALVAALSAGSGLSMALLAAALSAAGLAWLMRRRPHRDLERPRRHRR